MSQSDTWKQINRNLFFMKLTVIGTVTVLWIGTVAVAALSISVAYERSLASHRASCPSPIILRPMTTHSN